MAARKYVGRGKELAEKMSKLRMLSIPSRVLFLDATRAFDARAFHGATVMCRATLEAAFYGFLTRKTVKKDWHFYPPRKLSGEMREVGFDELRDAMTKRGILTEGQKKNLDRVQQDGNVSAHFASRLDRATQHPVRHLGADRMEFEFSDDLLWIGFTEKEAWRDLRDTFSILSRLSRVLSRRPGLAGPAGLGPVVALPREAHLEQDMDGAGKRKGPAR